MTTKQDLLLLGDTPRAMLQAVDQVGGTGVLAYSPDAGQVSVMAEYGDLWKEALSPLLWVTDEIPVGEVYAIPIGVKLNRPFNKRAIDRHVAVAISLRGDFVKAALFGFASAGPKFDEPPANTTGWAAFTRPAPLRNFINPVNYDQFYNLVSDPNTKGMTQVDRHLANQVVGASQYMPGGVNPGWVTPTQVGNLAVGMGTDSRTGQLLGLGLGLLTNMPLHEQNEMQQTGMMGQAINALMGGLF